MKICPYCAEKIKDDAIKCKHCNEWLLSANPEPEGNSETVNPNHVIDENKTIPTPSNTVTIKGTKIANIFKVSFGILFILIAIAGLLNIFRNGFDSISNGNLQGITYFIGLMIYFIYMVISGQKKLKNKDDNKS